LQARCQRADRRKTKGLGGFWPLRGAGNVLRRGRPVCRFTPPPQPRLARLADAAMVEDAQGVVVEEAAEVFAADVEGRDRGEQNGAGVEEAAHVLDVDQAVGGLPEAEDERPV